MAIAYNSRVVTSGLILCLDAANSKSYPGSGATWTDLSWRGNNGTLTNGPMFSSDNNGSIVFDGSNDYIDCGSAPQINSSLTGLTVSVWIKPKSKSTRCIAENGSNYTTNTFYMFQENANYFTFEVADAYSNYDAVYASYTYQTDVWYNLVGVWSSGSRVEFYTNGKISSGSRVGGVRNSVRDGDTNLFLGARAGSSFYFDGNFSSSLFYNRALTDTEIQQNFNALRGRYGI